MELKGLEKLTLIDFPGQMSCTVFTFGCNFRCKFCQNPELIKEKRKVRIKEKEFFDFLKERKEFLDAVCITGGEPTLHEDLPDFIKNIKKLGYLVKLDTNGTNPEMVEKLTKEKLVDHIAMDIKAPIDKYDKIANVKVDKEKIKKSVEIIRNSGIDYEFRTTATPDLDEKDFLEIAEWLKGSKNYYIQQFRPIKTLDKKYEKRKPYPDKKLLEIYNKIKPFFKNCDTRGINRIQTK